jgi:hypothetical protein
MLRMATCFCARPRAAFENTGSANAIIGLRAEEACDPPRRTFRLATEGKTVIACERTSQSNSLSFFPPGSFVTKSWGGRLVSAPFVMIESRFLLASLSANTPNVAR